MHNVDVPVTLRLNPDLVLVEYNGAPLGRFPTFPSQLGKPITERRNVIFQKTRFENPKTRWVQSI